MVGQPLDSSRLPAMLQRRAARLSLLKAGYGLACGRAPMGGLNNTKLQEMRWPKQGEVFECRLVYHFSSASQKKEAAEPWGAHKRQVKISDQAERDPVVYRGPFSGTLRKVKLLSLTSCCLSLLTGPAITFLTAPHMSVILKGGIASTVVILSASTTAALHWFTSPYIRRLTWKPGSQEIEVEVFSWLATNLKRTIQLSDIRPPKTNRPFVSFSANGTFYFVDPEKFPHKELLRRLTFYKK